MNSYLKEPQSAVLLYKVYAQINMTNAQLSDQNSETQNQSWNFVILSLFFHYFLVKKVKKIKNIIFWTSWETNMLNETYTLGSFETNY